MRCRICGYRCGNKEIARMAKHYRQKHPRSMAKHRKKKHNVAKTTVVDSSLIYRILRKEGLI